VTLIVPFARTAQILYYHLLAENLAHPLGDDAPGQRRRGCRFVAQNVDDLHCDNNKLGMQTSLTERGTLIRGVGYAPNRHDVLTEGIVQAEHAIYRAAPADPVSSPLSTAR